jgi:hypothetical protein
MATTAPHPTDPADLRNAAKDSQYLLAYFTRTKVDISDDKRHEFNKQIRIISSFTSDDDPSFDKIAEFWEAFISLSDRALPATIESIQYYFRCKDQSWFRPFAIVTMIALIMTIGLSLLSYIGSKAISEYDDDYAHWSQMQMLVRYLADGSTVTLQQKQPDNDNEDKTVGKEAQTAKVWQLSINPARAYTSPRANLRSASTTGPHLNDNETAANRDPKIDVPVAEVPRIRAILADAEDEREPTVLDNGYTCWFLFKMFERFGVNSQPSVATTQAPAQRPGEFAEPATPPETYHAVPAGLTWGECLHLMNGVKPHVLTVADDFAATYTRLEAERETLHLILDVVWFPGWIYHKLVPGQPDSGTESSLPPTDAFNLFVLLQQRNSPIPAILPIPSTKTFAGVFDARLAVAIANTYLLTFAFGLLGACVWVVRATNRRLENFTFAPSWIARYRARILLGMVAGPAIGLFFDQSGHLLSAATTHTEVPSLSTQLSAGAIAFVAGFSIEILFALLDRLIRIIREFAGDNSPEYQTVK